MKTITRWVLIGLMAALWGASAQARTWSGQVVDARTGQPVSDVAVRAGVAGRVDPFEGSQVITGADGRFRITWPEVAWKNWNAAAVNHYLRVSPPHAWRPGHPAGYWQVTVIRASPTEAVTVQLMPRNVFVKGQALSAEENSPLAGIRISLGRRNPGDSTARYGSLASPLTEKNGTFSIPLPTGSPAVGFPTDGAAWPTSLYDIPAGLAPKTGGEDFSKLLRATGPMYDFAVMIGNAVYPIPRTQIVTSIDDRVHTYVIIRHPAQDQPAHAQPITAELRGLSGVAPR